MAESTGRAYQKRLCSPAGRGNAKAITGLIPGTNYPSINYYFASNGWLEVVTGAPEGIVCDTGLGEGIHS